jgi:hypothetical protein
MKIRIRHAATAAQFNPQVRRIQVTRQSHGGGKFLLNAAGVVAVVLFILALCFGWGWSRWLSVKNMPQAPAPKYAAAWENSPWDGSVPLVKKHMLRCVDDPDSLRFESWSRVESWDKENGTYRVFVDARGKNAFGAYILTRWVVVFDTSNVRSCVQIR